jgi:hypothetical protein
MARYRCANLIRQAFFSGCRIENYENFLIGIIHGRTCLLEGECRLNLFDQR